MTCNIADELKHIIDDASGVVGSLGFHPHIVTKIDIYTTGSRPGVGTRNVVQTPIFIANGQNPGLENISSKETFIGNNELTSAKWKLGPLVEYYSGSCGTGGVVLDSYGLQFNAKSTTSLQHALYIKISGPLMEPSGSFFKIVSRKESSLSFFLILEKTGEKVQL